MSPICALGSIMPTPSANRTAERLPRVARRASRTATKAPMHDAVGRAVALEEDATRAQRPADGAVELTRVRADALAAMQSAAQWLSIDACALSIDAYRAFRATEDSLTVPSPVAVSILFGGWQRALEHVATSPADVAAVEEETIRGIHGVAAIPRGATGGADAASASTAKQEPC